MKKILYQIVKFGGVGALCFVIDFSVLWLLHDLCSLDLLVSTALAFTVSVVINYLLSIRFVFSVAEEHTKTRNFLLFVLFSVLGLGLTELLMHLGTNVLAFHYGLVKIGSTAIVMVFNFVTRKQFLEKPRRG